MTLHLYTHPACLQHDTGPDHPECPARLQTILDLFEEAPFNKLPKTIAREAEHAELLRAHTARYLEQLQDAIPERPGEMRALDADTIVSTGSWLAALHAAGAVCQAVDDIAANKTTRAFCAVRPPGHHAFPDHAEGFCLLNNVMIGALHALSKQPSPLYPPSHKWEGGDALESPPSYAVGGGIKGGGPLAAKPFRRVAIADFDVHHGNGSDAMARLHPNIFYASTHQGQIYPGTGLSEQDIPGRIANIPLAAGDGPAAFRAAWTTLLSALDAFAPDLVMISAGFDAHRDDPLAQLNLTEYDFAWITGELAAIADRHSGGKIVSVLEGGYNIKALRDSVAAHLKVLTKF